MHKQETLVVGGDMESPNTRASKNRTDAQRLRVVMTTSALDPRADGAGIRAVAYSGSGSSDLMYPQNDN